MEINELVPLLAVDDPDLSIDFYARALSFQVAHVVRREGRTAWATLRNGEVRLIISRVHDSGSAGRRARLDHGDAVLYLLVDSARDCHAALTERGVEAGGIAVTPYGMEEFRLRDPDGHTIAVGSPLMQVV